MVQESRPDHGLERRGEDGWPCAPSPFLRPLAKKKELAKPEPLRDLGQHRTRHHHRPELGEVPLVPVGEEAVQHVGHGQVEHGIAEELQTFVARAPGLVGVRVVGERGAEDLLRQVEAEPGEESRRTVTSWQVTSRKSDLRL